MYTLVGALQCKERATSVCTLVGTLEATLILVFRLVDTLDCIALGM